MHLAADDLRYGPHVSAIVDVARNQRRLRIRLVEIFDGGHRLDVAAATVDHERQEPLWIKSAIVGGVMFHFRQADVMRLEIEPLVRQRDAQPERRRGAEERIELPLHGISLPPSEGFHPASKRRLRRTSARTCRPRYP